jgi:hypothetical protein
MLTLGIDLPTNWTSVECFSGSTAISKSRASASLSARSCRVTSWERTSRVFAQFPPRRREWAVARTFSSSFGNVGTLKQVSFSVKHVEHALEGFHASQLGTMTSYSSGLTLELYQYKQRLHIRCSWPLYSQSKDTGNSRIKGCEALGSSLEYG